MSRIPVDRFPDPATELLEELRRAQKPVDAGGAASATTGNRGQPAGTQPGGPQDRAAQARGQWAAAGGRTSQPNVGDRRGAGPGVLSARGQGTEALRPAMDRGDVRRTDVPDVRVKADTVGVRFDPRSAAQTVAAELGRRHELLPDTSVPTVWLRKLAEPVVQQARAQLPRELKPTFHVMADETPLVVTLPSGEVFLSSGQLQQATDAGQVRQVVAREVADLALGHATRRFVEAASQDADFWPADPRGAAARTAERVEQNAFRTPQAAEVERKAALKLADEWLQRLPAAALAVDEGSLEVVQRHLRLRAWVEEARKGPPSGWQFRVVVGALAVLAFVLLARSCL
jgi:hypothetical protein